MPIGKKITVAAADVRVGDFTVFSGFRAVTEVRKSGLGISAAPWRRAKEELPRVAFVRLRQVEDKERIDRVHRDQTIVVYRQEDEEE